MYKDPDKQKEEQTREGHVYIVQCGDTPYYKIGVTQGRPAARIVSLQTGCPFKLHLIEAFFSYNAEGLEATIQEVFEVNRVRGEWYLLDEPRLQTLMGLFSGDGTITVFENEEERIRYEMNQCEVRWRKVDRWR